MHWEEIASSTQVVGIDLKPGESCVFQTSAIIIQISVEPADEGRGLVRVTGYHGLYPYLAPSKSYRKR
jgi:hypothetical protein